MTDGSPPDARRGDFQQELEQIDDMFFDRQKSTCIEWRAEHGILIIIIRNKGDILASIGCYISDRAAALGRQEAKLLSDRIISSSRFSNRPLYLQLRDALAERIASGEWKPTLGHPQRERSRAREFGVSAGTMRKALDLMEAERLLTRRQGRGTFVNDQSSDELAARFSNIRGADGKRVCGAGQVGGRHRGAGERGGVHAAAAASRTTASIASIAFATTRARSSWSRTCRCRPSCFPGLPERSAVADRIIVLAQEYGLCWARRRSAFRSRGVAGRSPKARRRRRLAAS